MYRLISTITSSLHCILTKILLYKFQNVNQIHKIMSSDNQFKHISHHMKRVYKCVHVYYSVKCGAPQVLKGCLTYLVLRVILAKRRFTLPKSVLKIGNPKKKTLRSTWTTIVDTSPGHDLEGLTGSTSRSRRAPPEGLVAAQHPSVQLLTPTNCQMSCCAVTWHHDGMLTMTLLWPSRARTLEDEGIYHYAKLVIWC